MPTAGRRVKPTPAAKDGQWDTMHNSSYATPSKGGTPYDDNTHSIALIIVVTEQDFLQTKIAE